MEVIRFPAREEWKNAVSRPAMDHSGLYATVEKVMHDVRMNGDRAALEYGRQFDGVRLHRPEATEEEIAEAETLVSEELKNAIRVARRNIETFHRSQVITPKRIETVPGVVCWQKAVAIDKVGLYVPGGTAPLFSTVLMLAVPAHIAGCREVVLCTPPAKNGKVNPAVLFAAKEAGVGKIFKFGGIQAIAAMTYGTESVPQVYKIFGPGNQYVTAAKQWVSLRGTAIDMPAGPSEVEVIADASADPSFVAADLLSQAEHGKDSQSLLVTSCESLVDKTLAEVEKQLSVLPRREIAAAALKNSRVILLKNNDEIVDFTNAYAPEHLIIETSDYAALSERIIHAGSIFLGHYTPESAGDYASGTNHTLPTNGYARMYSGVNMDSFVKKITFQEISADGIRNIGHTVEVMTQAELMHAHGNAVTLRMSPKRNG
ncbi:MAG: histidinol dehydrogenase [Bacteroidales bacterium]|jgi:histidinol dehydrogenase|nr:histidinol dehydrogenase [Bacteroidales bacterium]